MGSPRLRDVFQRIERSVAEGALPLVVFDLDSTLFSTGPRNLRILHEFVRENAPAFPGLEAVAAPLRAEDIGWNVNECLKRRGVVDPALHDALKRFWRRRFFTDDYLSDDEPLPGAPEYVSACHAAGAMIYYLTGRHVGGMEIGSVRALTGHGFPFWRGRCALHLKPSFEMSDQAFKDDAIADIRSYRGRVVATFENEPGNANLFLRAFPDALHFLLLTIHSPQAEVPSPELIRSEEFVLP